MKFFLKVDLVAFKADVVAGLKVCLVNLEVGVVPGLALLVLGLVIGALQEGHAALSRLREL